MKSIPILSCCALTALASSAFAVPTVNVGTIDVPVSSSTSVDVYVTGLGPGANALDAIDVIVSIGSMQAVAPAGEPKILNVDVVTGTVFDGNSANPAPGQVLAGPPSSGVPLEQIWQVDNITPSVASPDITVDGKLFTITFDTSGVVPGTTFPFRVLGTVYESSTYSSTFSNRQLLGVPFVGSDGFLHVTPEPSTWLLGMIGLLGLAGWILRSQDSHGRRVLARARMCRPSRVY